VKVRARSFHQHSTRSIVCFVRVFYFRKVVDKEEEEEEK
jgi:hypothetical protein